MIPVKVKKINSMAQFPKYKTVGSAGCDLCACIEMTKRIDPGETFMVPTGLIFEIPAGYEGQVRSRSGLCLNTGLRVANSPGTVDSDYRGEVKVILTNTGKVAEHINRDDRIAQIVFCPVERAEFIDVDSVSETERGDGGFGSTGIKD